MVWRHLYTAAVIFRASVLSSLFVFLVLAIKPPFDDLPGRELAVD